MSAPKSKVILVTGNDVPQITAEAERLIVQIAGEDPSPFALDIYHEGEEGPTPALISQLIMSLRTPPFLGGEKTVWLKHFTGFPAEEGAKVSKPEGQALKRLATEISELDDTITLVLDGPGCDGRKALCKACSAKGEVRVFNRPDTMKDGKWQMEMAECLQEAARRKGMSPLSKPVCDNLIAAIGADTAAIDSQLEKLICFYGRPDAEIDPDDVRILCPGSGEEQFFALNNAIGQRDLPKSLEVLNNLMAREANQDILPRQLLSATANLLRQYLGLLLFMAENRLRNPNAIKTFLEQMPPADKARQKAENEIYGYHPFRALKMAEQAMRFSPHELIQGLKACRDANWQLNSSSLSPRIALENALLNIIGRQTANLR